MKNTNNQPKRKPFNLLEYHKKESANDDFLHRIRKQEKIISEILNKKIYKEELKNILFIFEINKFIDDFSKIISILNNYHAKEDIIKFKINKTEELLNGINLKDLTSKTRDFYKIACNYDMNFEKHSMFELRNIYHPNTSSLNIDLHFSTVKSNYDNAHAVHIFLKYHDNYLKNFINVLYGDGKNGEKFIEKKLNEVIDEYKFIKEKQDNISMLIKLNMEIKKEEGIKIKLHNEIYLILKKYNATVYIAIIELLNFLEKSTI